MKRQVCLIVGSPPFEGVYARFGRGCNARHFQSLGGHVMFDSLVGLIRLSREASGPAASPETTPL